MNGLLGKRPGLDIELVIQEELETSLADRVKEKKRRKLEKGQEVAKFGGVVPKKVKLQHLEKNSHLKNE